MGAIVSKGPVKRAGYKGGWHGSILEVDLSTGKFKEERLSLENALKFIGGRGMGVLEVFKRLPPGINPISPENIIVLATGPLTGTAVPSSSRFSLVSKSPLTGTIFDSSCGGGFGLGLKRSGYDALVIKGKSAVPVYLSIGPDGLKVKEAGNAWGLGTDKAVEVLEEKEGRPVESLCIGPAGENLVPLSGVRSSGRMLGRGGLGAVMGSKNLKGIVAEGKFRTKVCNPDRLKFVTHEMGKLIKAHPLTSQGLPKFGTSVLVKIINRMGMFPARNFMESIIQEPDLISGEKLADSLTVRRIACKGCPIGCGRISRFRGREGEGPEYESIWALGPQCGILDLAWIKQANDTCNILGMDTISTGVTIGCAMEMAERNVIDWDLCFGKKDGLLELIKEMAYRRGRGGELSAGSLLFARSHGVEELAMQVKGLELPAYDPRGAQGQALGFATSNRGGCHLRSYMIAPEILGIPRMIDRCRPEGKAGLTIVLQNSYAAMDSLALCRFLGFALADEYYARALTAVTGEHFETQDMQIAGDRIWTLERLFNSREGFSAKDDKLPERFIKEPISKGPLKGQVVELNQMLSEYYRFRDYDIDGDPSLNKIKSLGLEKIHAPRIQ